MFTRIIDVLDSQVKTPTPADAATAIDDGRYDDIACHADDAEHPWCWCGGCQSEAQRRDDVASQLALQPTPAEAACGDDGFDFPPTRNGWTPEHDRVMARLWSAERGDRP